MKISFELDAEFGTTRARVRAAACVISARSRRSSTVASGDARGAAARPHEARAADGQRALLLDHRRAQGRQPEPGCGAQGCAAPPVQESDHAHRLPARARGRSIRLRVPLHFKGGAGSEGVKEQGGVLSHVRNDVEVTCLPKDLPEFVEVDVSGLEIEPGLQAFRPQAADGRRDRRAARGPRRPGRVDPHAARRGGGSSCRRRGRRGGCRCRRAGCGSCGGGARRSGCRACPGAPAAPGAVPAADAKGAVPKGGKDGKDAKKGDGKK